MLQYEFHWKTLRLLYIGHVMDESETTHEQVPLICLHEELILLRNYFFLPDITVTPRSFFLSARDTMHLH